MERDGGTADDSIQRGLPTPALPEEHARGAPAGFDLFERVVLGKPER